MLLVWLAAGAVVFLPFAYDTSAWDAVRLHVPGDQGNWWHFLAGAPFFLAFPMIWLRLRALFAGRASTSGGRRVLWSAIGLSAAGTILVESPFLLHLAGTSQWQRFIVLGLGLGILLGGAGILLVRRRALEPEDACIAGLSAAYLANAALCLVVYAGVPGTIASRSAWFVCVAIVWPMAIEMAWLLGRALAARMPQAQVL